jgi:hypothetical protein
VKKSWIARVLLVLTVIVATVFSGVAPATASGETASFSAAPNTFSAGGRTPAMSFDVSPNGNAINRIRISIYDSAGTTLVTSGSIRMAMSGNNLASCFMPMISPVVGCTKDGDDAGFFELSSTTSPQVISLDPGLFVLPSTTGNYNFHIGFWNGGSEFASANVPFTTVQAAFNITFNLNNGTGSQQTIVTQGTTFTLPQSTIVPPAGKQFAGWSDMAVSNTTLNAGDLYTVQQNTQLTPVWVNVSNNQQQNQSATFTTSNYSFQRASGPSFSSLAVGANVPAFTMTFSGYSGGIAVNQINYLLGDPYNNIFYTVPGSVTNNSQNYASWDPAASTCGITAIRIGGVAQTANSGVSCVKSTTSSAPIQYWNSVKFTTPTTAEISIDTAAGVFVVTQAGNLNYFATLFNNLGSTTYRSTSIQAFDGAGQSSPSVQQSSAVSFTIPVAPGQRIVGESVAIAANDLAVSTDYSVVLRSTPQILAQGRTVSSSFNTSVTIPNNLEPGWHSITFNATRSDGQALTEVVYFKINADGTLLASSTDMPAELALTGMVTGGAIPLSLIALLMGFIAFFVAREINPDFMRVMTLTRNANGELEFIKRRIRSSDF